MMYCQMPLIAYVFKGVQKHCQRYKNLLGHTQRTSGWRLGSYDEPIGLGSCDEPIGLGSCDEPNWIKSNPNWAN